MTYKTYYGLYMAETPLMHGADEKMETTTLCRYNMQILKDGSSYKVYNLSASTWRHVVRQNAAEHLFKSLDLKLENLPELVQIVFMSGGPRLEKGEVAPLRFKREIRRLFPMLDLLGTTTPFCMIEGKLFPTSINALTKTILKNNFLIESAIKNSFSLDIETMPEIVTEFQFNTKRDGRTREVEDIKKTEFGTVSNMFDTQVLIKGTLLGHQVVVRDYDSNLLSSCIANALETWSENGSYIGGKSSQGCGKVSFKYTPLFADKKIYLSYIDENKEILKTLLTNKKVWNDKDSIFEILK